MIRDLWIFVVRDLWLFVVLEAFSRTTGFIARLLHIKYFLEWHQSFSSYLLAHQNFCSEVLDRVSFIGLAGPEMYWQFHLLELSRPCCLFRPRLALRRQLALTVAETSAGADDEDDEEDDEDFDLDDDEEDEKPKKKGAKGKKGKKIDVWRPLVARLLEDIDPIVRASAFVTYSNLFGLPLPSQINVESFLRLLTDTRKRRNLIM
jgi:hypothetical protein